MATSEADDAAAMPPVGPPTMHPTTVTHEITTNELEPIACFGNTVGAIDVTR